MSGLINFFKSIFSGIFGFIGGLFGGKKSAGSTSSVKKGNGYFLELDESKVAPVAAPTTEAKPAAEQPMTVAKEAIAEASANTAGQPTKTSTRKEKLAALAADKPAATTAEAASAPTPTTSAPTPAIAKTPVSEAAFATKYLVPANNSARRRPGANMASYLDMARKMNAAG